MGVTRFLAALAALCLAGCATPDRPGPPATAPATTAPDGIRDRTVAWDGGRLDADPRRVVVTWTGASPGAGRAVADVRDLLVRIAKGLR